MNLQTRKINFAQDFLKLKSEKAIAQFENLLRKEISTEDNLKVFTINEFQSRINKSSDDSSKGKVTEVSDLISEIEKWS